MSTLQELAPLWMDISLLHEFAPFVDRYVYIARVSSLVDIYYVFYYVSMVIRDFRSIYENNSVLCQSECEYLYQTEESRNIHCITFIIKLNQNIYPKMRALMLINGVVLHA